MNFAECSLSNDEARRRIIDLLSDMLIDSLDPHEDIKRLRALLRCWKYTLTHDEWVTLINDAVRVGAAKNGIFFGIFGTMVALLSLLPSTVKGSLSGDPHDRVIRHLINRGASELNASPSISNKLLQAVAELSRGDVNWALFRGNVNGILLDLKVPDDERARILQTLNEYWTIEVGQQAADEEAKLRWTPEALKVIYALECSELLPGNMPPQEMRDLYLSTDRIDTDGLAADYAWQRYQERAGDALALSASKSRYDVTLQEIHYWIMQDVYDMMDWCRNRERDAQIGVAAITEDDILESRLHDEIGDDVSEAFIDLSTSRVVSYHDVGVVPSVNDVSMVFGINPVVVIVEKAAEWHDLLPVIRRYSVNAITSMGAMSWVGADHFVEQLDKSQSYVCISACDFDPWGTNIWKDSIEKFEFFGASFTSTYDITNPALLVEQQILSLDELRAKISLLIMDGKPDSYVTFVNRWIAETGGVAGAVPELGLDEDRPYTLSTSLLAPHHIRTALRNTLEALGYRPVARVPRALHDITRLLREDYDIAVGAATRPLIRLMS